MPSPGLIDTSTFMQEFWLVTACDNLSISTEHFRVDMDIKRARLSEMQMGPNAECLDIMVDFWTVDIWGATFHYQAIPVP